MSAIFLAEIGVLLAVVGRLLHCELIQYSSLHSRLPGGLPIDAQSSFAACSLIIRQGSEAMACNLRAWLAGWSDAPAEQGRDKVGKPEQPASARVLSGRSPAPLEAGRGKERAKPMVGRDATVPPVEPSDGPASAGAQFTLQRLGVLAEPDPDRLQEAWGITNPAAARGRDGQLYLFPRVVGEGCYSRIAVAHLLFDADGRPHRLERRGYALEPTEPYERNPRSGGGCEDARVSYLAPLDVYVMTYTASTLLGPRLALATSSDLFQWQRLGLLRFSPTCPVAISSCGNTAGFFFPEPVLDARGQPSLALIHCPTYRVAQADGTILQLVPPASVCADQACGFRMSP